MRDILKGGIPMNEKFVFAVYESIEEANKAVQNLTNAGIPASAITLYADDDVIEEAGNTETIKDIESYEESDSRTFWNRLTDFFSGREEHGEAFDIDFSAYEDEIEDDKILVVLDKTYEGQSLAVDTKVNVMDKNDPNQLETSLTKELAEPEATEAPRQVVAGDFAGESEESEAYYSNIDSYRRVKKARVESTKYERNKKEDEELRTKRKQAPVAGDMGNYSDYSEYYQVKEKKQSDGENYHDESYYNQGDQNRINREELERKKHYSGLSDVKRPVTQYNKTKPQLGEFEENMRRHEEYPPSDEEGVNADQFKDK